MSEQNTAGSAPDRTELRSFGLMFGSIIAVLFGFLLPWLFDKPIAETPLIVGGIFVVWALLIPMTLRPVFVVWMKFGAVMGWINTRIILGLVFYVIFFPAGMIMRLLGKDPMRRKYTAEKSYRVKAPDRDKEHIGRPY